MHSSSEKHPENEDRLLVQRARDGDRHALEELVRRHQGWVDNTALRMVFTSEVAQDLTQDVLVKMVTRLSSFAGRSAFRTWLCRFLANHVMDRRRTGSEKLVVSRARRKLRSFLQDRCSLMDESNRCRCRRKIGALVDAGYIDPGDLTFCGDPMRKMRTVARHRVGEIEDVLDARCEALFRELPTLSPPTTREP